MKLVPILAAVLALSAAPAFAATVEVDINGAAYTGPSNPKGVRLVAGQPFTVDIKIIGGKVADPIWLEHGPDVRMNGAAVDPKPDSDGFSFYYTAVRAGPVTFPGLDIAMASGPALHVAPIKLVVYPN